MSHIEHSNESFHSGNDEITFTPQFGKTDHDYCKIKHEPTDELGTDETDRAIMKIKSELKFLCSLQVSNSDKASLNQSNTDVFPSISSEHTTLEPSFELPVDENLFQEFLEDPQLFSSLDDDWLSDFPVNSIDQLLSSERDMTYKDLTDVPMDQADGYYQQIEIPASGSSSVHDETTNSSGESVSDNERDDINRRGLKKSGGPVRKLARFGNKQVVKYSDEYHDRRLKNNEAVKKSRMKAKEKQKDTEGKMSQLANENRTLSDRVDLLMKELQVLKSLYKELNQDLPASAVKALERVNVR